MNKIFESYVRNCWYVAGMSTDFPKEKLTGHVICEQPMVIWRTRTGQVVAYDDRCAHKKFPLSKGRLMADGTLECGYHGMRYDMTGKCVMIPAHPTGPISPKATVNPFPVIEQDGVVWVWTGDPAKSDSRKPPRLHEVGDEAYETVVLGPMEIKASYFLLIENILDITHFYPLHDGNVGDFETSKLPIEVDQGEKDGNKFVGVIRKAKNYKQPAFYSDWFHYELADRHNTQYMLSPATARVAMRSWPAGQEGVAEERGYSLFHIITPIDAKKFIWRVALNAPVTHRPKGDPSMSTCQRIAAMFPAVAEEDRWALEAQQPMMEYPDKGYQEVFLRTDLGIQAYRKIFLDLLREEEIFAEPVLAASKREPSMQPAK